MVSVKSRYCRYISGLTSVLIKRLPARLDSLILRLCLDSASENRFPYVTWSLQQPQPGLAKRLIPRIELCPAPFLGLTVQPCGEPCGSAEGFDFWTVGVI